ncbi:HAMP domain-containing sensor histidine kinase [Dictyobacter kobayashii]|uniref:histidine kinase n=1 Tax=Dictyobacter kobayashii TaxID=2014872 RepID=A0A402AM58_9CHLR|nr:sensor histidine kinase [Dictyobacter kobayashii]GCE20114.1 hypothetical protein KDK_39140 [Dictyobacter kobayashii]
MYCLFRPLHKLQWQLSLSYILVVVIAIPILLGVALALFALSPSLPPAQQLAQLLTRQVAPQIPHPITSQHTSTLNSWLVNFVQSQQAAKPGQSRGVTQLNATETDAVMIIEPTGQLAASVPIMPASFATGNPARLTLFMHKIQINVQDAQQVIQAAFANEQDLAKLVTTQVDGQTLVAVPILDHQQSVSGVLFVAARGLSNISGPLGNLFPWLPQGGSSQLSPLLPYALLLILVVSVIGTIVGMFTAQRITRRLREITSAAHAWSNGDFQIHIADRSPDELGQLAQDLNHMALQVQQLLHTRQQLASLEERQRVARDLHDSVKQQAFALTLLIGAAQSRLPDDIAAAQGSLSKAGELADQMRQELKTVLQQLRPGALVGQSLQAALRDSICQWSQQTCVACDFQVSEAPELSLLRPEIEEALFRVAQEAVANAARHSQASQIRVQLEQVAEHVCLHISDNGKGFAVKQVANSGHGLANMRERLEAYGGTLHIRSAPGETVVTGCIPFAQATQPQRNERKREYV